MTRERGQGAYEAWPGRMSIKAQPRHSGGMAVLARKTLRPMGLAKNCRWQGQVVMVAENGFIQSLCTQEAGSGREGEDKINQKFHELQKAATAQWSAGRWQHLSTGVLLD